MFLRRSVTAALVSSAAWSVTLHAAVIQLAPIPIEVAAPEKAAVLSLGNRGSSEVTLQVRAFRWTQEDGEDRLAPTQDLAVSPSIAVVPAGQALTVRVVRTLQSPPQREDTYRIWVDELPTSTAKQPRKGGALRILMRYSVPVFFEPADAPADTPALLWRLERGRRGEWRLLATNDGLRRVNFSELQLIAPDGKATAFPANSGLSGYVLAGRQMRWTLKPPPDFPAAVGAQYRLTFRDDTESRSATLALVQGK